MNNKGQLSEAMLTAQQSYIRDILYPELATAKSRVPNIFPVPTTVVNWRMSYTHTSLPFANILCLDPFS